MKKDTFKNQFLPVFKKYLIGNVDTHPNNSVLLKSQSHLESYTPIDSLGPVDYIYGKTKIVAAGAFCAIGAFANVLLTRVTN